MPTYEYRCPKGHEFELFQSMSEEPRTPCTACGEVAQRLISGGAGLIFKGDGFYITDYRSDEYKKAAASEKKMSGAASGDASGGDSGGKSGKSDAGKSSGEKSSGGSDKASSSSKGSSSHASGSSGGSKRSDSGKSSSSDS